MPEVLYVYAESNDLGASLANAKIWDDLSELRFSDIEEMKQIKSCNDVKYIKENFVDLGGTRRERTLSMTLLPSRARVNSNFTVYSASRDFIISPDIGGPNVQLNSFSIGSTVFYDQYQNHRKSYCWRKFEKLLNQWILSSPECHFGFKINLTYGNGSDCPLLITYAVLVTGPGVTLCSEKLKIVQLIKENEDRISPWDFVPVVGSVRTISSGIKKMKKGDKMVGAIKVAIGVTIIIATYFALRQLYYFAKGAATGNLKLGAGTLAKEATKAIGTETIALTTQTLSKHIGKETIKDNAAERTIKLKCKTATKAATHANSEIVSQLPKKLEKKVTKEKFGFDSKLTTLPYKDIVTKTTSVANDVNNFLKTDLGKSCLNTTQKLVNKQNAAIVQNSKKRTRNNKSRNSASIKNTTNSVNEIYLIGISFRKYPSIKKQVEEFLYGTFGWNRSIVKANTINKNTTCIECSNQNEVEGLLKLNKTLKVAASPIYFAL